MLFLIAAMADLILALLHVVAIFVGAPAYEFLRAGDRMVAWAKAGESWPSLLTAFIAGVFFVWALISYFAQTEHAWAKWARILVILIGCVFVLRGAVIVFQIGGTTLFSNGEVPQLRDYLFSLAALSIGGVHLLAAFRAT